MTTVSPRWGVESAEGYLDSYWSAASVLDLLRSWEHPVDAVVMAGFGEHGREGLQEVLDVPVVDITEAAAHFAYLLGYRYSVVTTLDRAVPLIEERLLLSGVHSHCASVRGPAMGAVTRRLCSSQANATTAGAWPRSWLSAS